MKASRASDLQAVTWYTLLEFSQQGISVPSGLPASIDKANKATAPNLPGIYSPGTQSVQIPACASFNTSACTAFDSLNNEISVVESWQGQLYAVLASLMSHDQ